MSVSSAYDLHLLRSLGTQKISVFHPFLLKIPKSRHGPVFMLLLIPHAFQTLPSASGNRQEHLTFIWPSPNLEPDHTLPGDNILLTTTAETA